ncbi:hypothetical protein UFOVP526_7 [uncultured Caudovirales phage]|uniref:Uncharacterized protein n=1 Tax=uncultured Caudovirales phage TaxID=2100421 RepID=A0A6J5MQ03_9CAUD|nr:hypothetical protein UFOVP526_7 [uncultured Caudovirales phage]
MKFIVDNVWVWAGTGLVLITLSGQTRRYGVMLTVATVAIHVIATLSTKDKTE